MAKQNYTPPYLPTITQVCQHQCSGGSYV